MTPYEQHANEPVIRQVRALAVSLLLVTSSCGAGWRQPANLVPGRLPQRQQVQVWHQGRALRWHAVQVETDTIRGIPYLRPVDCDTCLLALPRASVDSIRLGNPVAGFWKTVALIVAIPTGFLIIYCWNGCYST
jgi:hypothetical protein